MQEKGSKDILFGDKVGVKIITGPAGRKGKPAGIYVVRTFFERDYPFADGFPSCGNSDGQYGLS
jgi:hypothetical protein